MKLRYGLFITVLLMNAVLIRAASVEKDLTLSLSERQIQDLSLQGLSLVFYVKITNSSSKDYYLSGYNYRFVVNQTDYIQLKSGLKENKIKIDALKDTFISFPIKITYVHLFQVIKGLETQDKVSCYLTGIMNFSDGKKVKGKLPFAFSGEFPLFKTPELAVVKLKINNMTIGGADLGVDVKLTNNNGFELMVDKIVYRLQLQNRPIGQGEIKGDKNIKSRKSRIFYLPLLLNFFEVGKEIYNILLQSEASCHFQGEMEVQTVWGKVTIPLDKVERVLISRIP